MRLQSADERIVPRGLLSLTLVRAEDMHGKKCTDRCTGSPLAAPGRQPSYQAGREDALAAHSGHACVGTYPGGGCHGNGDEQHGGPGADRQREHMRDRKCCQADRGEDGGCARAMTLQPCPDAPQACDQKHYPTEGA